MTIAMSPMPGGAGSDNAIETIHLHIYCIEKDDT